MIISQPRILSDRSSTGVVTNTQSVVVSTSGAGVVSFSVAGVWTGSLGFEATVDGTTWVPAQATPILPTGAPVTGTTTNGRWTISVGGFNAFRVRGLPVTTGSATIYATASQAESSVQSVVVSTIDPSVVVAHNEITLVATGAETTVITVTAISSTRVRRVEVSGENVALFRLKINGTTIANCRSWWGAFNQAFDLSTGLVLNPGQVLTVTALHNRPTPGNFEATVLSN